MKKWTHPQYYMGETYEEYYVLLGQHRDSNDLDKSNFDTALSMLGGESETVIVARASHWAVGWVETILIHESAADKVEIGEQIEKALENYPVLDEDDYSRRQWDRALYVWAHCFDYQDRKALCLKYGCDPKAARTVKSLPRDDDGELFQYLTTD